VSRSGILAEWPQGGSEEQGHKQIREQHTEQHTRGATEANAHPARPCLPPDSQSTLGRTLSGKTCAPRGRACARKPRQCSARTWSAARRPRRRPAAQRDLALACQRLWRRLHRRRAATRARQNGRVPRRTRQLAALSLPLRCQLARLQGHSTGVAPSACVVASVGRFGGISEVSSASARRLTTAGARGKGRTSGELGRSRGRGGPMCRQSGPRPLTRPPECRVAHTSKDLPAYARALLHRDQIRSGAHWRPAEPPATHPKCSTSAPISATRPYAQPEPCQCR
jgi:hypothetical protein